MKLTPSLSSLAVIAALLAAPIAHAVTFTLNNSTATVVDPGNIVSTFYEATPASDSGTMGGVYTFIYSGTGSVSPVNSPFTIEIVFNGPQPLLTEAFFKASNRYMYWDSADLTAFNAGVYTSITLVGNGLLNNPGNAYNGLSHAGLIGSIRPPGGSGVPDGGSTAVMLGLGLIAMAVVVRRRS